MKLAHFIPEIIMLYVMAPIAVEISEAVFVYKL